MSGRRPTGRFFIMLILLGVIAYFALERFFPSTQQYAMVLSGSASQARSVRAVIVRDEPVASMDSNSTITYVAQEGAYLSEGDEIAYVFSAGYSAKEMAKLEDVRQDIRAYHGSILQNIVEPELERLDLNVTYMALQLKALIQQSSNGSLTGIERQLTDAMSARQDYLSQNRREDTKLNALYEEENKREVSISSWRSIETASGAGVVSFYLDGYEEFLTPANLESISLSDVKDVLAGKPAGGVQSRLTTNIYRLVRDGAWYVLAVCDDVNFNPVIGQEFWFQLEGFEDLAYPATAVLVERSRSEVLVTLEITDAMGPLINQRAGGGLLSAETTGLIVPARAIVTENGQRGVRLYDGGNGLFVPVNVISSDGSGVLVTPLVPDSLTAGSYVLI